MTALLRKFLPFLLYTEVYLTEESLRLISELFNTMDVNSDGTLSKEDFMASECFTVQFLKRSKLTLHTIRLMAAYGQMEGASHAF